MALATSTKAMTTKVTKRLNEARFGAASTGPRG